MINNAKNWIVVSYATTLPNVFSVFNMQTGEVAHLEYQRDCIHCHACRQNMPMNNSELHCRHLKAAHASGMPDATFDGTRWWLGKPADYLVPEYDPWHEVGKMLHKLVNICHVIAGEDRTPEITKSLIAIERELEILTQWRLRERERST